MLQSQWSFDCTNYLFWKEQLLSSVIAYGLDSIIDQNAEVPNQYLTDSGILQISLGYQNWNKHNNLLKSWIYNSVSKDVLCQVCSSGSPSQSCSNVEISWKIIQNLLKNQDIGT